MKTSEFKIKIASIYEIANELGREFNINKCTPDGHLLGSIGQIAAKIAFGLSFGSDLEEHNCTWSEGKRSLDIQVRCTARRGIALRKEPKYLIALEVLETGSFCLLYNGPGKYVWDKIKHQKQNQKFASKKQLYDALLNVRTSEQIPIKSNLFNT